MDNHDAFTTLLELSSGARISPKLLNATPELAMLVSITKSLVEAREKFLQGTKLVPFHGLPLPLI
jgi:hypothetical protein